MAYLRLLALRAGQRCARQKGRLRRAPRWQVLPAQGAAPLISLSQHGHLGQVLPDQTPQAGALSLELLLCSCVGGSLEHADVLLGAGEVQDILQGQGHACVAYKESQCSSCTTAAVLLVQVACCWCWGSAACSAADPTCRSAADMGSTAQGRTCRMGRTSTIL